MQSFFDMGKGEYQIMENLTKYEMETVVNYNAGEQTATVYTRDKSGSACGGLSWQLQTAKADGHRQDLFYAEIICYLP